MGDVNPIDSGDGDEAQEGRQGSVKQNRFQQKRAIQDALAALLHTYTFQLSQPLLYKQ